VPWQSSLHLWVFKLANKPSSSNRPIASLRLVLIAGELAVEVPSQQAQLWPLLRRGLFIAQTPVLMGSPVLHQSYSNG
tara:strand:+ start:2126 stop:2359 length:234 start_codon:yes stop_codon:yes gene_type:complete